MKIRPQRKAGLEVSLSKKFYQRSTIQTQSEIHKIQAQNVIKKQMIQRMAAELQNLQNCLGQSDFIKQTQKHEQSVNHVKNSPRTIKTQKSPNKNTKFNNSMNIKINKSTANSFEKRQSLKQFARSQSAFKQSSKRNSNRNSFSSVKRNSKCIQQPIIRAKQICEAKSLQQLKYRSHKTFGGIKAKKDQNYVKYLECRLRQLAKEVKLHNEAQLTIQKNTINKSRRV